MYFSAMDADITQIAATSETGSYSAYILPTKKISAGASQVTGLTVRNGQMFHNNTFVPSLTLHAALQNLISFIRNINDPLLVAHNAFRFDSRLLISSLQKTGLLDLFKNTVKGFCDTLPLSKELYPDRSSYKQENLVQDIVKESYAAHDAVEDARLLYKLVSEPCFTSSCLKKHSITVDLYCCRQFETF